MENNEVVDIEFPIYGTQIPAQHGYQLMAAIANIVPSAHSASWLGIHNLKGRRHGAGQVFLVPNSSLRLRMPLDRLPEMYSLAGATLDVGPYAVKCGLPRVRRLAPSSCLWSRLVVVKIANAEKPDLDPECFLSALSKRLRELEITGKVEIEFLPGTREHARRIVRVRDVTIPGYGVYVRDLSDEDSIRLQVEGLGGRRRFGCGLFLPVS